MSGLALNSVLVEGAVIAAPVRDLTAVLLGVLVATAMLARIPALRWTAVISALLIAPLLLAGVALDDARTDQLTERPLLLAAAILVGGIALIAATACFVKWPRALPVVMVLVLPLRLPISVGGDAVNLLLPLYGVIGAGSAAYAYRAWKRGREKAAEWDLRTGPAHVDMVRNAWSRSSLHGVAAAVPILLAALVLLYALRVPFSLHPDQGAQTLCFFLVPFSVMFVLLREMPLDRKQLQAMAAAIVFLALIAVALGSYEWATGRVLWGSAVLDPSALGDTPRVNSLFFDPNIYGRFLMVVLLGVLTALVWGRSGVKRGWLLLLLVVLWLGLLVSFSQSSMLGLMVGGLVLLGLRYGALRAWGLVALLAAVGAIGVVGFGDQLRVDTSSSEGINGASAGRWELMKGGVELAAEKPIFGWGSGSYRRAYREHTQTSGSNATNASHTIPITYAAEQGLIGLAVYLALIVAVLLSLIRGAATSANRAAIGAAMAALIVHTWFYAAFLEDPLSWALLALGLTLGAAGPTPGTAAPSTEPGDGDEGDEAVAAAPASSEA